MAALPGCEELLRGLACFDPNRRWSMQRALQAQMFDALLDRDSDDATKSTSHLEEVMHVIEYFHYMDADASRPLPG